MRPGNRGDEEGKKGKEETSVHTFPESPEPFLSGNGLVGINSTLISLATSSPGLSLEPDLYHIRGLGHSHSQGTCGAACQEAAPDAGICGRTRKVSVQLGLHSCYAFPHQIHHFLPFGNRIQTSSSSKKSSHQIKYYFVYQHLLGTGTQQGVGQNETLVLSFIKYFHSLLNSPQKPESFPYDK